MGNFDEYITTRYADSAARLGRATLAAAAILLSACSANDSKRAPEAQPRRGPVRITQFYASPPQPPLGERSLVCYGTENATEVRLEPADSQVWPSPSRCFEVVPRKPVTYTLTASRGAERVTRSLTVAPGAPLAELVEVRIDAKEVEKGTPMTVCYQARNAASVTVTPGTWVVVPTPERGCVKYVMEETTLFKVRVRNAAGDIVDGEDVEVKVR
jgi:hypothetical protein